MLEAHSVPEKLPHDWQGEDHLDQVHAFHLLRLQILRLQRAAAYKSPQVVPACHLESGVSNGARLPKAYSGDGAIQASCYRGACQEHVTQAWGLLGYKNHIPSAGTFDHHGLFCHSPGRLEGLSPVAQARVSDSVGGKSVLVCDRAHHDAGLYRPSGTAYRALAHQLGCLDHLFHVQIHCHGKKSRRLVENLNMLIQPKEGHLESLA